MVELDEPWRGGSPRPGRDTSAPLTAQFSSFPPHRREQPKISNNLRLRETIPERALIPCQSQPERIFEMKSKLPLAMDSDYEFSISAVAVCGNVASCRRNSRRALLSLHRKAQPGQGPHATAVSKAFPRRLRHDHGRDEEREVRAGGIVAFRRTHRIDSLTRQHDAASDRHPRQSTIHPDESHLTTQADA